MPSFGDLAGHIAEDANGDAVITLGVGETITLHGVDAASLTSSDFVFNQVPLLDNAGTMTISDGAMLPLDGMIDNTGTIALNSTGDSNGASDHRRWRHASGRWPAHSVGSHARYLWHDCG